MELEHLREYVMLARNGSFTDTARSLHITQSTLSKHVAALEREFNCVLITRSREGSMLTEPGRLLYLRAIDIINAVDRTRADMAILTPNSTATAIDTAVKPDPRLRKACRIAAEKHGLTPQQAGALALFVEGMPLDDVAIALNGTRDDAGMLLADAYRALGVESRQQAYDYLHSILECN
ncbi:HTH-type transcriptional activator AmpR [Slackia heliotrinireducens]|uniref:Transcriptional regulator n=1 Tax=Slackia heliotrinireducens (strain ATCC 29202 / DSM 20476 / NCTC 11029 / RHS 1) TaxID=471855 RepID=C7N3L2_SLAHD|nr:LysR family transcriptional regulator [Slackia heliotrinireducens]ACV23735.1 transcriptional regulator [Slackia heliotrinireducens DSM 20476]VEH03337.1 HTH-type transcriptional activator AmpR [Slackia heliotrinireducens]